MQQPAVRAVAPSLAAATMQELRRHAPFDRMEPAHLDWLVARLALVYFAPEATVLHPGGAQAEHLYIVKQGAVLGFDPELPDLGKPRFRVSVGECFPLGALIGQRPVTSAYRAAGDTFCYRLAAGDFAELLARSPVFRQFATQRLGNLLAQSRRNAHADHAMSLSRQPLDRPVRELVQRPAVSCERGTPLRVALATMRRERVGSILVTAPDGAPAGIFTLRDLRDRVALGDYVVDQPIDGVMTRDPVTLSADAMAFEAALTMARHGFHHVVVTDGGRAEGVVSESDLFALQRVGLTALSAAIRSADSVELLASVGAEVRRLMRSLLAQGVPAEQLTRIISTLNDLLTARVLALETRAAGLEADAYCWLALGSEGRHEQTLATDQDNAIVFPDPAEGPVDAARERLLPFARAVNRALAACGFPLCRGEIMAGNPRWCLSLSEWQAQFSRWMSEPDAQALLNSTIFFDFRGLHGDSRLAQRLRGWLADAARPRDLFRRFMAENALRNEPPLGLVRDFAVSDHEGRPDTLDLKVNGAALFADAARILALETGDRHTGTAERLRGAGQARKLAPGEVEGWIDAFHFIQSLRMLHQQAQIEAGAAPDNYLRPDELNALDRRILKEALRQARKLQERLRLDYRL
jgi:CBS domain-containing protein